MDDLKKNEKIKYYELKCSNCNYVWNTKYSRIPASCPSCKQSIHNTSNYKILKRIIEPPGCCIVGLVPIFLLFLPFITLFPNKSVLLSIIDFHQKRTSPMLSKSGIKCKYCVSCSNYSKDIINKDGAIKGGWKSLRRIVSCR
jgi:uncharacterized protein